MSSNDALPKRLKPEDIKFTPFVAGKIQTWFRLINVKKNGFMGKEDYEEIAERFVKQHKLDEVRRKTISDWLINGWSMVFNEHAESTAQESKKEASKHLPLIRSMSDAMEKGEKTSEETYVEAFGELIENNSRLALESLERMVDVFFDVFDANQTGYISRDQMVVGLKCFGITDEECVKKIFDSMDTNKDGKLSRDEYVYGWVNFILGNDRSNPLTTYFAPHLLELLD